MNNLFEDSRSQLLARSKKGAEYAWDKSKGKNRYERRLHSKVAPSVSQYNSINMNRLFKDNILDVDVEVHGETDDYHVKMSFGGFLDQLHRQIEQSGGKFDLRVVTRSLVSAFNDDNVYIHCDCPDWIYRFGYWAKSTDISSTPDEEASDNGKGIANPHNDKGAACKHVLLCLSNNTWLIKVASVVTNYVNYMQKHYEQLYADIIYPAIYEGEYTEPVQMNLINNPDDIISIYTNDKKHTMLYHGKSSNNPYAKLEWRPNEDNPNQLLADTVINGQQKTLVMDTKELETNKDVLDVSNKWAKTKNLFKKGNQSGVQFASNKPDKQINFDNLISDTNIEK